MDTYFAMITHRAYEQLTPVCDNVSARGSEILSPSVYQLFIAFCNIVNCLWKGLIGLTTKYMDSEIAFSVISNSGWPLAIFCVTVYKQERHQDVVRVSNTRGRENRETGETVTLMAAQF